MNEIIYILSDGGEYSITKMQIDNWSRLYKNINVKYQVEKLANKSKKDKSLRKTSAGINRYINNELNRLNASK